jgi:predicted transcriptional regulator
MPSNAEIARKTGLSRSTVREHLNNYTHNPLHKEQEPIYGLMNEKVVAVIMKEALKGNMQAARLYLDVQGKNNKAGTKEVVINNQHNYIQINNTVLSQQTLQQLKPEQLLQIEQLIQRSLLEKLE